jgi:Tfp pilus assembly protein PilF
MMRALTKATLLVGIALLVGSSSGCGYIHKVMARAELNDGAREYNNGNFVAAAAHFKTAKEEYPSDPRAWLFYAQAINAQVAGSTDGKTLGTKAITAFEDALQHDPNNDVIYAFIAHIYGNVLGDQTKQFEWLLRRANLPNVKPDVKRDVFYNIGVNKWQDAYPITTRWADLTKGPNRADDPLYHIYMRSDMPADDRKKAEDATTEGLEYLDKSLNIDPEYANAYSYVALLNREQAKLADKDAEKKKYLEEYKKNVDKFVELNKKAEAAQAAAAPAAADTKK